MLRSHSDAGMNCAQVVAIHLDLPYSAERNICEKHQKAYPYWMQCHQELQHADIDAKETFFVCYIPWMITGKRKLSLKQFME